MWLHRGAVACAYDLALGKSTNKYYWILFDHDLVLTAFRYVEFAMHRVRMLIHFGITPYIVFDGDYLPSKAQTETARAKRRADSRRQGLELHRLGKPSQANLELQKAIEVTPEMARQLIEELKRNRIDYVVAPYEADAQLAYLERKNIIQGVITEDSDLLVFGVKRLLTKLDQYGECVEINRKDFTACKEISLVGWTDADFRRMAILSGCDYLANIPRMGLKTAYRLVRKHKDIETILRVLSFDGTYRIPSGYLEDFKRAELTFLHQRVFDPTEKRLLHGIPLSSSQVKNLDFVGKDVDASTAVGVATGNLHPTTKEPIICYPPLGSTMVSQCALNRRRTINTPSELKPKKPINEFFKPSKRVPLAELDPNSFTPSPSQQRLLEQQSGSILSTPVEGANAVTRMSSPTTEHSERQNRSRSEAVIRNPPKRQRLCAEDDSDESNEKSPLATQSRFFNAQAVHLSPSLQTTYRKPKSSQIELWSDTSVGKAITQLPEVSCGPLSSSGKMKVLRDGDSRSQETGMNGTIKEHQPSPTAAAASELSSLSSAGTQLSSFSTKATDQEIRPSQHTDRKPTKKITSSFMELSKKYSMISYPDLRTPPKASDAHSVSDPRRAQPKLTRLPPLKPSVSAPLISSAFNGPISYPQLHTLSADSEPRTPRPPTKDLAREISQSPELLVKQSPPVRGSEDLLVPCSEAESEGEGEEENISFASTSLNIARFAFLA